LNPLDRSDLSVKTRLYRLVSTRPVSNHNNLSNLGPSGSPKKREEVAEILRRLARELIPEAEAA